MKVDFTEKELLIVRHSLVWRRDYLMSQNPEPELLTAFEKVAKAMEHEIST